LDDWASTGTSTRHPKIRFRTRIARTDSTTTATTRRAFTAITKKTDYWFNRELDQLEQEQSISPLNGRIRGCHATMSSASESSSPSSARHESLELFRQWHRRVRIQDADQIQSASSTLNRLIVIRAAGSECPRRHRDERKNTRAQIESFQQFKEPDGVRVGYDRMLRARSASGFLRASNAWQSSPLPGVPLPADDSRVTLARHAREQQKATPGSRVACWFQEFCFNFVLRRPSSPSSSLLGSGSGRSIVAFSESEAPMATTTITAP